MPGERALTPRRRGRDGLDPGRPARYDLPMVGAPARLVYVGHATVLIEMDGVRLITDPVLRNRVAHLRRRVPVDRGAAAGVDAVLVSHGHRDHLDLPSLARVDHGTRVLVPRGLGRLIRGRGFTAVTELEAGESTAVGPVEVRAFPVDHEGGRGPLSGPSAALGFAVHGSRTIAYLGDTDLFPEMEGLVAGLDVALVPIWGWGPSLGRHRHMDPERAAEAVRRLAPRVAVPVHWGTFHPAHTGVRREPGFLTSPGPAFEAAVARVAPGVEVRLLGPGEETVV